MSDVVEAKCAKCGLRMCHSGMQCLNNQLTAVKAENKVLIVGLKEQSDMVEMVRKSLDDVKAERDRLKKKHTEVAEEASEYKRELSHAIENFEIATNYIRAERDELQALFDLQHKRSLKAIKVWQDATDKHDQWPDLGVLLEWLLANQKGGEL